MPAKVNGFYKKPNFCPLWVISPLHTLQCPASILNDKRRGAFITWMEFYISNYSNLFGKNIPKIGEFYIKSAHTKLIIKTLFMASKMHHHVRTLKKRSYEQ